MKIITVRQSNRTTTNKHTKQHPIAFKPWHPVDLEDVTSAPIRRATTSRLVNASCFRYFFQSPGNESEYLASHSDLQQWIIKLVGRIHAVCSDKCRN